MSDVSFSTASAYDTGSVVSIGSSPGSVAMGSDPGTAAAGTRRGGSGPNATAMYVTGSDPPDGGLTGFFSCGHSFLMWPITWQNEHDCGWPL